MSPGDPKGGVSSSVLVCNECIIPTAEIQPARSTRAKVCQVVVNWNLGCSLSLITECCTSFELADPDRRFRCQEMVPCPWHVNG